MTTSLIPGRTSRGLSSFFGRDPFRAMRDEMDDMLSRFTEGWNGDGSPAEMMRIPSLDLSEADNELQITMDLPGVKPDEIDVNVTGNTIRISGEHKEEKEEKGRTFHRIERRTGSFCRSVNLPCDVKEDKAAAEYKDGVLRITLPKSEEAKTRKLKVKG